MLDFGLASEREIRQTLCQKLRAQRLHQNLSQTDLAQRAGLSVLTLQRLEAGHGSTLENFLRTVMALGLASELTELFNIPITSIAAMEQAAAHKPRQRATKRSGTAWPPGA